MERKDYAKGTIPRQTLHNRKKKLKTDSGDAEASTSSTDNTLNQDDVRIDESEPILSPSCSSLKSTLEVVLYPPRINIEREEEEDPFRQRFDDLAEEEGIDSDEDTIAADTILEEINEPSGEQQNLLDQSPERNVLDQVIRGDESASPELKICLLLHIIRIKHGLTQAAMKDIIEVFNSFSQVHLGKDVLPKDPRTIARKFEPYLNKSELHHVCTKCGFYRGMQPKGEKTFTCTMCGHINSYKAENEPGSCFMYMPLRDQLVTLFEHRLKDKSVLIRKPAEPPLIESIVDGAAYQEIVSHLDPQDNHITLSFGCDGVPIFKSSGSSIWPLLASVDQLPLELRKQNMLMPALWYGQAFQKPDMNQYFVPWVRESMQLHYHGFNYVENGKTKHCKVTVTKIIADSVARVLIANSNQFNGERGCLGCYHPGEQIEKGRGTVRIYPHVDGMKLRTAAETHAYATEASLLTRKPYHVMGIKGHTIVNHLPLINLIKCLVPDYMHCSILGHVRHMLELWFDPKYAAADFNIRALTPVVDKRLLEIRPPLFVSRPPRSMNLRKFFKGHELYVWCFVYSLPVLKGVLKNRYLQHWSLYVEGMFLLLQESISRSQVFNAKQYLIQFINGMESLYGREHLSFNLHLHEHLPDAVLDWGPLPEQSAFYLEDYNQVLIKAVHSSKGVLHQISEFFRTNYCIPSLPMGNDDIFQRIITGQACHSRGAVVAETSGTKITFLDGGKADVLKNSHHIALVSSGLQVERNANIVYYKRVVMNGEMFHSKAYLLVQKRNSYCVLLRSRKMFEIDQFVFLQDLDAYFAIGSYFVFDSSFKFSGRANPPHLFAVKKTNGPMRAISIGDIETKVVFMSCPQLSVNVCCVPPNRIEVLV